MTTSDSAASWVAAAQRNVWQPYTQMKTAPTPIPITHAEGVYLYTAEGSKLLDGVSSWWVNIHGHNHPRLNRALTRQAEQMAHVIFAGLTHEPGARLAQALVECTPGNLPHVFYTDDGSTAVEAALKMAHQHWRLRGETKRNTFVAIENGYHGDTFGAMSVGDVPEFQAEFESLLFDVKYAAGPHRHHDAGSSKYQPLETILEQHGNEVAAVVVEPMIQGAGGMIISPPQYLRHVRDVSRQHSIPLIADEVFTGFGRTGKLFACEHASVEPDIICLSKGLTGGYLPLAATLASDEIYNAFLCDDRAMSFFHGHSYTGNALGCALGVESLAILNDTQAIERVGRLETLFSERLERLSHFAAVRTTRGLGGVAVIELHTNAAQSYLDKRGPGLTKEFIKRGLLLRPLGNVVYFVPPYVITDEEAQWAFDVIEEVLGTETS